MQTLPRFLSPLSLGTFGGIYIIHNLYNTHIITYWIINIYIKYNYIHILIYHTIYYLVYIYIYIYIYIYTKYRLPWWLGGKDPTCQCRRCGFDPWVGKISWRRKWQPTPVFIPGKSHVQRRLVCYSPWGHKRVGHDLGTKQQQHI